MLKRNIKCCYGFCIDKIYAVTYDVKLGECSAGHYLKEYALNVLNAATTKYIEKEVHQMEYISRFPIDIHSLCQRGSHLHPMSTLLTKASICRAFLVAEIT